MASAFRRCRPRVGVPGRTAVTAVTGPGFFAERGAESVFALEILTTVLAGQGKRHKKSYGISRNLGKNEKYVEIPGMYDDLWISI